MLYCSVIVWMLTPGSNGPAPLNKMAGMENNKHLESLTLKTKRKHYYLKLMLRIISVPPATTELDKNSREKSTSCTNLAAIWKLFNKSQRGLPLKTKDTQNYDNSILCLIESLYMQHCSLRGCVCPLTPA